MSAKTELGDWTPVLKGDTYCSPRCGGQCTKASYDRAVTDSETLARQLGEGWKGLVWENLGWFWSVSRGRITVHRSSHGYYALISGEWTSPGSFPTALEAIQRAVDWAREDMARKSEWLAIAEATLAEAQR